MRCSVQNCTNDTKKTTKSQGITFHLLPKEAKHRRVWLEAIGQADWEPKERSTICSEHFRNEDFYLTKRGLRKIKSEAVPFVNRDTSDDLDAPAALRVCRICLAMDVKMYQISEYKQDQLYEQLTGLQVYGDSLLPQRICWECSGRLASAVKFRTKAIRANSILQTLIKPQTYIRIRDIKSINRTQTELKSDLIHKMYENNDFDLQINNTTENVKEEAEIEIQAEPTIEMDVEEPEIDLEDIKIDPITEVEVKHENNEIYFNEYDELFDASDDRALSEVCDVKKDKKIKKRKIKDRLKIKKVKKQKIEQDDNPETATDRYKNNNVKRRRINEALDEALFTVTTLTYDEQIEEVLKRQESVNYISAPYKCEVCFRGFLNRDRYTAHIVRHSEQCGAFECFICKTRLKTSRALRKHLTAQHTEQYRCNGCPFVTRNRGVAREHERWHAGTKYQCPHCASEFDKLTTYMGHIRIKHVSDFVCELCGYTFVSQKGIDVHKKKKHRQLDKTVTLEGPYCGVCDVKFVSEEAHGRHLKLSSRHSSDQDPNRIRNDSQSMHTDRSGRIVRRIERRPVVHVRDPADRLLHADPNSPVACEQCGIQLRDLRLYAQHFRRMHPDKNRTKYPAMKTPCMCEQCGKIFQSMALLKDHMWVHTGEKRFKCDRCNKSFTQKTNLVFHMRVHSAARPTYECPLCGKHFAFFNNRRRHMFIHTGLKPFKCDTCGKCFTTSGEQRAHVEHVHLKKPWPKRARVRRDDGVQWQKCDLQPVED